MEEQYIVSARKYRPSNFRSVVGQRALTETLKNAIANHHLAHAYLFCGPRGVGKTTCARIFAKAINCEHLTPEGEACEQCESCRAFNEGRSFNIHELDAASNNGVEDIRSLVDQVRIPPQVGKYSVYIVDEVHMLSTAAFNAFLKTLEEPPSHAIFILATTEKHKILPTILSRCQIYDFNRITVNDAVDYLQYVAGNEGVKIESAALNIIAKKADGAMRDALSIFDQVVSFCGRDITYKMVIEDLNVLDSEYYFRLIDLLLNCDVMPAMLLLDEVLRKGFDAGHFVAGLASHIRDLMMCQDAATAKLLEVSDDVAVQYAEQSKRCSLKFIFKALELTNKCSLDYRVSQNKRLLVELLLVQLSQINAPQEPVVVAAPQVAAGQPTQVVQQRVAAAPRPMAAPVQQRAPYVPPKPQPSQQVNVRNLKTVPTPTSVMRPAATQPTAAGKSAPTLEPVKVTQEYNSFSEIDLRVAWNEVAEDEAVKSNNYRAVVMRNYKPQKSGDVCKVFLVDKKQMDVLREAEARILSLLQAKLHNSKLTMEYVIDADSLKNEAFTPEQKLQSMCQKNPAFKTMVEKLHLELL